MGPGSEQMMSSGAQAWRSSCRCTTWLPEKGTHSGLLTQSYLTGNQHGLVNEIPSFEPHELRCVLAGALQLIAASAAWHHKVCYVLQT